MDFDFNSDVMGADAWVSMDGDGLDASFLNDVPELDNLLDGFEGDNAAPLPDLPQAVGHYHVPSLTIDTHPQQVKVEEGFTPMGMVEAPSRSPVDQMGQPQYPPTNSTPPHPHALHANWNSPSSFPSTATTPSSTTSPTLGSTTSSSPTSPIAPRKCTARRQPKQALSEAEKKERRKEQNRLAQERVRAKAKNSKYEANHLKEENISLRHQLNEKEKEVVQLQNMVRPLQEQVQTLTQQNSQLINCLTPHRVAGAKAGVRLNVMSYPCLLFLGLILLTGFLLQSVHSPALAAGAHVSIKHNTASLGLRNLSTWAPRKRPMALPPPLPRPGRRVLQSSPQHPPSPVGQSREGERGGQMPHAHTHAGDSEHHRGGEGFIYLKIAAPQFKRLLEWVSAVVTWVGPRYEAQSSFEFSDKDLRVSQLRNATMPMPANCAAEGTEDGGPPCGIHFDVFLPTFSTHPAFSASGELPVALPGSALGSLLGVFPVGAAQ